MEANEVAYVRQSSAPYDSRPWQVRRNRPDQTFEILSRHITREGADAAVAEEHAS